MFFKTRKNKQFTYLPRFYNQQKEELEERIRNIESEIKGEKKDLFRSHIRRGVFRQTRQGRVRQSRNAFLRLAIILLVLFLLIFVLYNIY
jgi:hypothetical protein